MNRLTRPLAPFAIAAALFVSAGSVLAQSAAVQPSATPGSAQAADSRPLDGPRHARLHGGHEGMGMGHGMRHGMGMDQGMGFLRGVQLSEAQRDQVFTLMHQQAPAMRDKAKALGRTRQELRALALSPQFDESRARALSQGLAAGVADMAVARARTANAVWQLLTPEQKAQVEARRARADAGGHEHEHGHRHLALR